MATIQYRLCDTLTAFKQTKQLNDYSVILYYDRFLHLLLDPAKNQLY